MEILRVSVSILPYTLPHTCFQENRLAQLATVDQQRELMRYMRGLNEWLERDVYDRQSELRGVVACVEQLRHDIRGMRAQGKDFSISIIWVRLICILKGRSSRFDDTSPIYQSFPPQPDPRFPQPSLRYPPVIPPAVPETTRSQGRFIPPQAFPQPPGFPQPQVFPQPITVTTPASKPCIPFWPTGTIRASPRPPNVRGWVSFITPDLSPACGHSTGELCPTFPMSP